MKYLYYNSKFTEIDKVKGCQSPLTYFLDIPILSFTNRAKIRIGSLDLLNSKEYDIPIQIGNIILRDFELYTEDNYIHFSWNKIYIKAHIQIILHEPGKYILKDVVFKYIREENLEFFLNKIIPLINWGINTRKDLDLIFLFSLLMCKEKNMSENYSFENIYIYLSKNFLKSLTVKQRFEFDSRVGRDDYAYEYTTFIIKPRYLEEYYCVKLIAKELAKRNITPPIDVKIIKDSFEISYCSMFDNNAFPSQSREYTVEQCNGYKGFLMNKYEELYNNLFNKFTSLIEDYKSFESKQRNCTQIVSVYDPT